MIFFLTHYTFISLVDNIIFYAYQLFDITKETIRAFLFSVQVTERLELILIFYKPVQHKEKFQDCLKYELINTALIICYTLFLIAYSFWSPFLKIHKISKRVFLYFVFVIFDTNFRLIQDKSYCSLHGHFHRSFYFWRYL